MENIEYEIRKKKRLRKSKKSYISVRHYQRNHYMRKEKILEEMMAANFPNLMKYVNINIPEVE